MRGKGIEFKNSHYDNFIEVVSLDSYVGGKRIGCIKLDLEGSEYLALHGAKEILANQQPLLMVSIYHKRWDIIDIPKLILEINEKYRFAFGHYSVGNATETVLYAF